jgi:hypothetical protein
MMKKYFTAIVAACAMLLAMPASATIMYTFGGTFAQAVPNPADPQGAPLGFEALFLTFTGIADGSAATSASYESPDGEEAFEYSKFALSQLWLQVDDSDPLALDGSDYFFFTAPTVPYIGFGKGDKLLFGGVLYEGCGCTPIAYDGTSLAFGYVEGGSFDDPITFGGQDHLFASLEAGFAGLDPDALGAVPEPASWALMMIGFGATGAAMRRRRIAVRTAA